MSWEGVTGGQPTSAGHSPGPGSDDAKRVITKNMTYTNNETAEFISSYLVAQWGGADGSRFYGNQQPGDLWVCERLLHTWQGARF